MKKAKTTAVRQRSLRTLSPLVGCRFETAIGTPGTVLDEVTQGWFLVRIGGDASTAGRLYQPGDMTEWVFTIPKAK